MSKFEIPPEIQEVCRLIGRIEQTANDANQTICMNGHQMTHSNIESIIKKLHAMTELAETSLKKLEKFKSNIEK